MKNEIKRQLGKLVVWCIGAIIFEITLSLEPGPKTMWTCGAMTGILYVSAWQALNLKYPDEAKDEA